MPVRDGRVTEGMSGIIGDIPIVEGLASEVMGRGYEGDAGS